MKIPCLLVTAIFTKTKASNLRFDNVDAIESNQARNLVEERSGDTLVVTITDIPCNYQNLKDACLQAHGEDDCDIPTLLGVRNEAKAERRIDTFCRRAFEANKKTKSDDAGAIPYQEVTNQGYQFDNEYYDGGTKLNAQYDPVTIDESSEGFDIDDFYDTAQTQLVEFPEEYLADNFGRCKAQSVMCCWVQDRQAGDNNGDCAADDCDDADPADNTDICYNDLRKAPLSNHVTGGFSIYEDDEEGETHCHGFAWPNDTEDANYRYRGNVLFYVSMYDHLYQRGYVRELPGAPMCSCTEKMPVVSRSDCTEMNVSESYEFTFDLNTPQLTTASVTDINVEFIECQGENNNDLRSRFDRLDEDGYVDDSARDQFDAHIVGECDKDVYETFLNSLGYTQID